MFTVGLATISFVYGQAISRFSGVGVVISSGVKRFFSQEFSFSEATRA